MNVSQRGLDLLKSFEGLRLQAYDDGTGTWTIGYGLTFYPDSGRKVQQGDEIDAEAAEEFFAAAVGDFAADVGRLVHVPLSQQQFDALVSLAYNIGTGALEKSTLLQKLNAGDYYGAADEFPKWNKAGGVTLSGLVKRRAAERTLFLEGTFPTKHVNESQSTHMPIPAVLAAVLPSLVQAAPALIRIFGDGRQSEKNAKAAELVAKIAVEATGATNEQAAAEAISKDPKAAEAFQGLVQARWFELTEVGGGVQEARAFTERLIGLPDWRGVGFSILMGVLALTIVFGGGLMLWSLLQDPATPPEQKGMVLGAIIATIGAPVAFFFGSSASSRAKDQALIDRR
jgi:lysozyme